MTSPDIQQEIESWRDCDEQRLSQNPEHELQEWLDPRPESARENKPNTDIKTNVIRRIIAKYLQASIPNKTQSPDAATLTALWENANNRLESCELKSASFWLDNNYLPSPEFVQEFNERADRWRMDTSFQSSLAAKFMHEDYQIIMAMGPQVIPLILNRLRTANEHWFWALKHLAKEDMAIGADNPAAASKAWIEWGIKKGIID